MTSRAHYAGCHRVHLACARERVRRLRLDLAEAEDALGRLERRATAQDSAGRRLAVVPTHPALRDRRAPLDASQAPANTERPEGPEAA